RNEHHTGRPDIEYKTGSSQRFLELIKRVRYYIFLRDVLLLALTTFGGPQAHLAYFQKVLVDRRGYLTEAELMELNSLCQMLPGPASTQTLIAVGFRIGGPNLAYLTLLVW